MGRKEKEKREKENPSCINHTSLLNPVRAIIKINPVRKLSRNKFPMEVTDKKLDWTSSYCIISPC